MSSGPPHSWWCRYAVSVWSCLLIEVWARLKGLLPTLESTKTMIFFNVLPNKFHCCTAACEHAWNSCRGPRLNLQPFHAQWRLQWSLDLRNIVNVNNKIAARSGGETKEFQSGKMCLNIQCKKMVILYICCLLWTVIYAQHPHFN